ncbi:ATP-binding cassette sub-family A member 3-like, partial [Contarinia nasturtii]|uniref:ATP-binding cassette sub-family A member 3-like n=1 Tax=Contarinia nasturtii TaxID=265458 RepID=UPI0012D3D064
MTSVRGLSNYWQHIFSENSSDDEQSLVSSIGYETSKEMIEIVQRREQCKNRKTANIFDKFCLLMWKNFLLQYRHKIQTIFQIFIPMLFTVNLLFIRILVKPEIEAKNTYFKSFDMKLETNNSIPGNISELKLIYWPKNEVFGNLTKEITADLSYLSKRRWKPMCVQNSTRIGGIMKKRNDVFAAVVFHHKHVTVLPKKLDYSLRFPGELRTNFTKDPIVFSWQTNMDYPQYSGGGPRAKHTDQGGAPNYFFESFLAIQQLIAFRFTINHMQNNWTDDLNRQSMMPTIKMQRFPYPPYMKDDLLDGLDRAIGLFIMLSFVYPIICTVRIIAVEKEKQLKEIMKIMGMPVWLHWASWFVRTMFFLSISNILVIGVLKFPVFHSIAIFTHSDWKSMWGFLLVYGASMTTYCFMLSVLFSKANTAAAVSGLIWFVSYMPYVFLTINNNIKVPKLVQRLACISPNVAMSYGFKTIAEYERNVGGWRWGKSIEITDGNIEVETTMWFMTITAFVFLLIAFYIEKVFPGEYGVPHKWNFFCKSDFWLGDDGYTKRAAVNIQEKNENFEYEPVNCEAGVRVKNLRKIFTNGKVACKNVTFNMFRNQITVLLGHNGAGKSTTIKMLTGLIPPTSGTAIINGYDIRTDLRRARESIGICPQHDILFDELTVREHIEFYCR